MSISVPVIAYNFPVRGEDDIGKGPIAFKTEGEVIVPAGVEDCVLGGAGVWFE